MSPQGPLMSNDRSFFFRQGSRAVWGMALLAMALLPSGAWAQTAGSLPVLVGSGNNGTSFSVPIQTLLFFTALSFLPAVLLMMTGFTRIVIVFAILRQALGLPKDAFVVCSFGFMAPTKLNSRLVDAWLASSMAEDENCYLVFVGEPDSNDYGSALQKKILASSAAQRIRITGFASVA